MKRRETFRLIPLTAAGLGVMTRSVMAQGMRPGMNCPMGMRGRAGRSMEPGGPPDAMTYINGVREMLIRTRNTQAANIIEAGHAVARTVLDGRTCWSYWDHGHTHRADVVEGRWGDPDLIVAGYDPSKSRPGDLMMAGYPFPAREADEWMADLKKKDLTFIGTPSPVGGDCINWDDNIPDIAKLKYKPLSDIWIETGMTSVGAKTMIPGSAAPLGPVTGPLYLTIWWMIVADACRALSLAGRKVKVKGDEPELGDDAPWVNLQAPLMDDYFGEIMREFDLVAGEMGPIRQAARMASESLRTGGSFYVYSKYPEALRSEATGRRGGLACAQGASDGRLAGEAGDTVFMGILAPDDESDLANLREFKKRGMKVVSIGPALRGFAVPEGATVPKEADVHIGRMMDTYGKFAIPGFDRKVCPTSGVMTVALLWATTVEIVMDIIRETGETPGIFFSGSLTWGGDHNSLMRAKAQERGY